MNQSTTMLNKANTEFRNANYEYALRLYSDILKKSPELAKVIGFNVTLARRKLRDNPHGSNSSFQSTLLDEHIPSSGAVESARVLVESIIDVLDECELITFDIWDTVLRRLCEPDEIKLRTARVLWLLSDQPQEGLEQVTPIKLFWLRKEAERNVADEHYEYRIADVLQEWLKLHGIQSKVQVQYLSQRLLECELQAEYSATGPDETIAHLLNELKGKRTLAISDFYHSSESLGSILEYHGLKGFFDRIYVSCDWMKTKRAGHLYDLVFEKECINPGKIIHIGDNPHADYKKAQEKGIRAFLYENPTEKQRNNYLRKTFEEYLDGHISLHYKNIFKTLEYSHYINPFNDLSNVANLKTAGKLLSPIVVGFVLLCMQEAVQRKCPRIFFFAREGIFFKRIYEELVALDVFDLGNYPKPEIIYASRRATFSASLRELSLDEMMRMWNMYSTQSINAMARSLNLDLDKVASIACNYGLNADTPIQYPWLNDEFKKFFHSSEFQSYAIAAISQQKQGLLNHLREIGFDPDDSIDRVIVDIGWRGTIQDNISYLVKGHVHGIYLALKNYFNSQPPNVTKQAFLSDDNTKDRFDLGDVAALEFILNAPGGSAIGYEMDGTPRREIITGEEKVICTEVAEIQSGIIEGSKKLGDYIRHHGLVAEDLVALSKHLVSCYINNPPRCIADAFLSLEHNETFGTGEADYIGQGLNIAAFSELSDAALHSALMQTRSQQRWASSLFNTTPFKNLFASFRPDQTLNIPCNGHQPSVFSIIRPESRRDIISIITPAPLAGSGGHRTIYNFAKGLAREGFDVHVMMESVNNDLWYVEQELAGHSITLHKEWFAGVRPRVAVATIAHSAKYVRNFFPDSIGAYFVQDYEAEFNPLSDGYVRGQNSYAQGLSPICIGHWLPHVLRKQFGIGVAYGGLGVDTNIYYPIPNVEKKDMVAFLYQPEKWRRMPETCIGALAIVKQRRPQTEIVLYGSNAQPNLPFEATQLGLIHDLSELNRIYNEASVGLCLSLTNPSRIPIEYMAAGCVPVDLYRYNNLFDNPTGTSLLAYQSEESIAEAIIHLLENNTECQQRRMNGIGLAQKRTLQWEVDAACNAIKMMTTGFSLKELNTPQCAYIDQPFVSEHDRMPEIKAFCDWQHKLAN
jgi:FMN phosphatase YigB (HAD superfamily)